MLLRTQPQVRKGQAMVEYALLVVCIAVVGAVATSMLGHKTQNTLAIAAGIMPGAHTDDNAPIQETVVIPTMINANGAIVINTSALVSPNGLDRYAALLGPGGGAILVLPQPGN